MGHEEKLGVRLRASGKWKFKDTRRLRAYPKNVVTYSNFSDRLLVARNKKKLDALVEKLKNEGIEASAFSADIINSNQLADAFKSLSEKSCRL